MKMIKSAFSWQSEGVQKVCLTPVTWSLLPGIQIYIHTYIYKFEFCSQGWNVIILRQTHFDHISRCKFKQRWECVEAAKPLRFVYKIAMQAPGNRSPLDPGNKPVRKCLTDLPRAQCPGLSSFMSERTQPRCSHKWEISAGGRTSWLLPGQPSSCLLSRHEY